MSGMRNTKAAPHMQAVRLAFMAMFGIMLIAAISWATSNIRQIPPQSRAVVMRFGALNRVQNAGLTLAWPQPFERVLLVPDAAQVIERKVEGLLRSPTADLVTSNTGLQSDAEAGSGYLLTADASAVHLDVRVFYRVTDPVAYVLQGAHVIPTLDRLATRSAVMVCASRDLDSILVARPELVAADSGVAERRERLRADLVIGINDGLRALATQGLGLGIEVERADVQSSLPASAIAAFDGVLTASQQAEQAIAAARNDAAKQNQAAAQAADLVVKLAQAQATERVGKARTDTATITGLATTQSSNSDPGLLQRLYRARIATILSQAGSIVTIDPRDDARLILQGVEK
ncbi:SPFH domain-containing protein [Rhizobium sp. L51/94]|uniref:SPFH domain-containing protein n=1 Tax=Rhizobium sp. L51/94 TaxID=2819999 RepID=UPI001C5ACED9|nr:SPFH domain-containing protein [Rhizobium sp. L51/94]QXZ81315.1 protease modulator HflK [Rhizobium sp. L51/94]